MVLKLIDNNTTKNQKYDWDSDDYVLSMDDEQITKLKEDLEGIFGEEN